MCTEIIYWDFTATDYVDQTSVIYMSSQAAVDFTDSL